jgi:hypothetical protein
VQLDDLEKARDQVALTARSRRDLLDAVRRALAGAARTMGGLDRCDATLTPRIVRRGTKGQQFQVTLSVSKRTGSSSAAGS